MFLAFFAMSLPLVKKWLLSFFCKDGSRSSVTATNSLELENVD
jgi:hypothetical protein